MQALASAMAASANRSRAVSLCHDSWDPSTRTRSGQRSLLVNPAHMPVAATEALEDQLMNVAYTRLRQSRTCLGTAGLSSRTSPRRTCRLRERDPLLKPASARSSLPTRTEGRSPERDGDLTWSFRLALEKQSEMSPNCRSGVPKTPFRAAPAARIVWGSQVDAGCATCESRSSSTRFHPCGCPAVPGRPGAGTGSIRRPGCSWVRPRRSERS